MRDHPIFQAAIQEHMDKTVPVITELEMNMVRPCENFKSVTCLLCEHSIGKQNLIKHLVKTHSFGEFQSLLKDWVSVKDGHAIGNKRLYKCVFERCWHTQHQHRAPTQEAVNASAAASEPITHVQTQRTDDAIAEPQIQSTNDVLPHILEMLECIANRVGIASEDTIAGMPLVKIADAAKTWSRPDVAHVPMVVVSYTHTSCVVIATASIPCNRGAVQLACVIFGMFVQRVCMYRYLYIYICAYGQRHNSIVGRAPTVCAIGVGVLFIYIYK